MRSKKPQVGLRFLIIQDLSKMTDIYSKFDSNFKFNDFFIIFIWNLQASIKTKGTQVIKNDITHKFRANYLNLSTDLILKWNEFSLINDQLWSSIAART